MSIKVSQQLTHSLDTSKNTFEGSHTFFEPSTSFFFILKINWKRSFRSTTRGSAWVETQAMC